MSIDTLVELISDKRNPTVVGLDPRPDYIPKELLDKHYAQQGQCIEALASSYLEFNMGIIDAIADIVPAVKPQVACYEALGPSGMEALRKTMIYAKEHGLFVIADAKRGDIGSTSEAYSAAFLGRTLLPNTEIEYEAFPSDALTINPYLGSDNLNPFLADCDKYGKMVFVLCKTSNKSSMEVQELDVGHRPLYKVIAEQCVYHSRKRVGKSHYSPIGIVVGATHPRDLTQLRRELENIFFLVPGFGAQGGDAGDVRGAFDRYGRGAIINNSRGIICAWQKSDKDFASASRQAALNMKADILSYVQVI